MRGILHRLTLDRELEDVIHILQGHSAVLDKKPEGTGLRMPSLYKSGDQTPVGHDLRHVADPI